VKREDFIYYEEHISPDGVWRVEYGYSGGEKGPTIVEPRVIEIATGRVLVDFWRRYTIGYVGDFSPDGFRITLTEPIASKRITVSINTRTETFTMVDEASSPRPIDELYEVWGNFVMQAQREREAEMARSAPPAPTSLWERLRQWFFP
jgi:hypothetical protein